jgi:hypothetical protein
MHHGDELEELRRQKELKELLGPPFGLGATGRFPEGKLNADDEGEIAVGIAADRKNRKVVVDFGKPVAWIGFSPEQATELGEMLIAKGMEARGIEGVSKPGGTDDQATQS